MHLTKSASYKRDWAALCYIVGGPPPPSKRGGGRRHQRGRVCPRDGAQSRPTVRRPHRHELVDHAACDSDIRPAALPCSARSTCNRRGRQRRRRRRRRRLQRVPIATAVSTTRGTPSTTSSEESQCRLELAAAPTRYNGARSHIDEPCEPPCTPSATCVCTCIMTLTQYFAWLCAHGRYLRGCPSAAREASTRITTST